MDPRPSRRADLVMAVGFALIILSQWILGRVVALTRSAASAAVAVVVSMDPRPSRRADEIRLGQVLKRLLVSMDPRPSRRADSEPSSRPTLESRRLNGSSAESSR